MFGFEDRLLHSIAGGSDFLSANNWMQKFWPVHVIDVGRALETIAYDDSTAGQTFELYGTREYSKQQVAYLIYKMILKDKKRVNLPKPVLKLLAKVMNMAWWPTYCPDEIEREFIDQTIDPTSKTFKDLGIVPGELDDLAFQYIRNYR
jgi:NADH dehydrogenase (ubiquinone) 1 alpha subcomplex subunit 9